MSRIDPYETLGVAKDATEAEIKAAYRRRSKEAHPDHNGDRDEFEAISRSKALLLNPEKRERYDRTGQVDDGPAIGEAEAAAYNMIASMAVQCLNGAGDPTKSDVVQNMRQSIKEANDQADNEIAKLGRDNDKARAMLERFTYKGKGPDIIGNALKEQIAARESRIEHFETQKGYGDLVLKILEDYDFRHDPPEPVQRAVFIGNSTGY